MILSPQTLQFLWHQASLNPVPPTDPAFVPWANSAAAAVEEFRQYTAWSDQARAQLQVITNPNPPEDGAAGVPAAEAPTPVLGGGDEAREAIPEAVG